MYEPTVSSSAIFRMVNEEYSRLRPVACSSCITPVPIRKVPPIETNWQLSAASPCAYGCREILRQIETRLSREVRLEDPWASTWNRALG